MAEGVGVGVGLSCTLLRVPWSKSEEVGGRDAGRAGIGNADVTSADA